MHRQGKGNGKRKERSLPLLGTYYGRDSKIAALGESGKAERKEEYIKVIEKGRRGGTTSRLRPGASSRRG